jgi:hypothetical protein
MRQAKGGGCHLVGCWILLIFAVSAFMVGCSMVTSREALVGKYRLNTKSGSITLDLSEDGHFFETIVRPSGAKDTVAGSWSWNQNVLNFDRLWIPREFAPDYIQQADALAKDQPKYTEPGHWGMRPEKHWGTVILSIFPDNDENFRKTN